MDTIQGDQYVIIQRQGQIYVHRLPKNPTKKWYLLLTMMYLTILFTYCVLIHKPWWFVTLKILGLPRIYPLVENKFPQILTLILYYTGQSRLAGIKLILLQLLENPMVCLK